AMALFDSKNVLGKNITQNNNRARVVTAVIKDVPAASTLQFDAIIPFNMSADWIQNAMTDWVNCNNRVYFKVKDGVVIPQLEKKMIQLIKDNTGSENPNTRGNIIMHPMSKWRLYGEFRDGKNTGGRIQYVNLFTWIAVIILLIACVNFMNLSTARSEKRAREVGIRKTLGSDKSQLLIQFIAESMIMSTLAFLFAALTVYLCLPSFNNLLDQEISIPFGNMNLWLSAAAIILFTGIIAGSYPAFYLSSMKPIKVLKGVFTPGKNALLPRKILVTAQFTVSIVLISATLVIYQQIKFVQSRDLGYSTDNLIMTNSSEDLDNNYIVYKNSLLQTGFVESVNRTTAPISSIFGFTSGVRWTGAPADPNLIIGFLGTDEGFIDIMKARILEGRDFQPGDTNCVLFNKEAIRVMGIKNPVGNTINWAGRDRRIVGVVDNMIMESPYSAATPLMFTYSNDRLGQINIRLKEGTQLQKALSNIEALSKKYNPRFPFEYRFADTEFQNKFANEQLIESLGFIFAGLAIFVCCLGLFGLVSFSIERRSKEIGIRKVMGASITNLLALMSKEFLLLVSISFVVAIPIAWWAMNDWLTNFSYRINIGLGLFIITGIITLLICMITVSLNAFATATANPIKSLRTE
ncbi:MAG: FtsX-like permease family protein, partial [Chitinophagaceae bacterium]|nr:FtsX-like permease family protein [Chitinophagaceae bacterium]